MGECGERITLMEREAGFLLEIRDREDVYPMDHKGISKSPS
jgi:hypothetical protein